MATFIKISLDVNQNFAGICPFSHAAGRTLTAASTAASTAANTKLAQAGRTTASLSANLARAPPRGRGRPSSARAISPKYLTWRHPQRKSFERFRSCWSTPRSKTLANPREETRCPAKIRREAFRRCRRSQPAVLSPFPAAAVAGCGRERVDDGRRSPALPIPGAVEREVARGV